MANKVKKMVFDTKVLVHFQNAIPESEMGQAALEVEMHLNGMHSIKVVGTKCLLRFHADGKEPEATLQE